MPLRINSTQQPDSLGRSTTNSTRGEIDFTQVLSQTQKLQSKELESFLKKLDSKGQQLAESFSLRDLADFKDMIKTFLRSTFGQSRKLSEEAFWDYHGRPKVLARITSIDKALEDLGRKLIEKQAKPIDILDKVGEIRGLIVDLFG